jgi:glycosyl transferase family 25
VKNRKYLNFFDGVYYINLDERQDRRELFEKRSKTHDIEAIRFPGIIPKDGEFSQLINGYDPLRKFKVGCSLSHQAVIKMAKESEYENVLIFEDDCVFSDNFKEVAQNCVNELKNINWNIMYFGGLPNNYCESRVSKNLYKMGDNDGVYCLHAYAVHNSFYDKILEVDANSILTIDNFFVSSPSIKILSSDIIALQDDDLYSNLWGYVKKSSMQNSLIESWNKYVINNELIVAL